MSQLFEDKLSMSMFVEEIIHETVSNVIRAGNNKLRFNCPICGETTNKRRGWFDTKDASYICWNGGCPAESGMTGLWFASILRDTNYGMICAEYIKWSGENVSDHIKSRKSDKLNKPEILDSKPKLDIGDNWVDLPKVVIEYCKQRGLYEAPFKPDNWEFFYDLKTKRLVIPWMENGEMVYYQKRKLISTDEESAKYIYPTNEAKPVFNIDKIDGDKFIYVCEGALDSIFLYNSISCGGISPSQSQLATINSHYPNNQLVIVTDNYWIDRSSFSVLMGNKYKNIKGLLEKHLFDWKFFSWSPDCLAKDINEAIKTNPEYKFYDYEWLLNRTVNAMQMKLQLSNSIK